ncbi:MAG: TerC family protein [Terrimicrobiaceae bacterium]
MVGVLLALDLGLFQKKSHAIGLREALVATSIRVLLAVAFGAGIWSGWIGDYADAAASRQAGSEYFLSYLLEIALSVDNVFVFALLFQYFRVPPELQPRVLFWGILGALAMRAGLIIAGIALVERFHWILYAFALLLIYGGVKMMRDDKEDSDPSKNPVVKLFHRLVPMTDDYRGSKFLVNEGGRRLATPLCLVLVAIETTDLIFAIDSVPAVLGVTRDFFIVFTSNVFAILGLRSLYFALAGIIKMFRFLHYGLSAILIFIGVKMLLHGTPMEIHTGQSLIFVVVLLGSSIVASLVFPERGKS